MKRRKKNLPTSGLLGTAVATATILGCSIVSQTAQADSRPDVVTSGIFVSILTPTTVITDRIKELEVSAFYQAATSTGGVNSFELFVDGQREAIQNLDVPDMRGVVSFRLTPGTLTAGTHHFVITVSAADAEVASAKTDLTIAQTSVQDTAPDTGERTSDDSAAPSVAILSPLPQATITGTVDIKVDAHDNSGKPPYVSLFIDNSFKTLRNYPPFDFSWDTTHVQNGLHTIEVWGYNDDQAVGHAQPLTVFVNNPSGRTTVRTDLLDTVPTDTMTRQIVGAPRPTPESIGSAGTSLYSKFLAQNGAPIRVGSVDLAGSQGPLDSDEMLTAQGLLMTPSVLSYGIVVASPVSLPVQEGAPALASGKSTDLGAERITSSSDIASSALFAGSQLVPPSLETSMTEEYSPFEAVTQHNSTKAHSVSPVIARSTTVTPPVPLVVGRALLANLQPNASPLDVRETQIVSSAAATTAEFSGFPALQFPSVSSVPGASSAPTRYQKTVNVSTGALLATSHANNLNVTRMASATIDSSELFSPTSSLQNPNLPLKAGTTHLIYRSSLGGVSVLGQSSIGFPVNRISGKSEVVMNDRQLALEQPLQDRGSFLYAPLRQIFESEGGVISWSSTNRRVHALNGSRDILLTIGSHTALVNEQPFTMTGSPYVSLGHTMIPLSFVPIALDATVSFDPLTGHLLINSNN